ncbi:MAG: transposase [Lachnospiraceae bacterium]|nr:transposase [Lachnospiraceae bacterium]
MRKRNRKNSAERIKQEEKRQTGVSVNSNYKDTVFRMLFKEKKRLLDLYNAVAGKEYTDPERLEIVTLENAIYMEIKNDLAFLIDFNLYLFEHQSTVNKNMPLRFLQYVTAEYSKLTAEDNLYAEKLIRIPAPHFIVFYNGSAAYPEEDRLKLSDAYQVKENAPELELRVRVFNINEGFNKRLKEQCRTLEEYMQYVDKVRTYARDTELEEAVDKAIDECIEQGILKEFLSKSRAEVRRMSIFEYDEEATRRAISENAYERGVEDGEKKGIERGIEQGIPTGEFRKMLSQVCKKMKKNQSPEKIAEELEEEISAIEPIVNAAKKYAPDYDIDSVFAEMQLILRK